MAFKVVLTQIAEENQIGYLDYYLSVSQKVAVKFLDELDVILKVIEDNPHLFSVRYKDLRIAHIKKFKTLICYRIEEEAKTVIIYTIVRSEQHPASYLK